MKTFTKISLAILFVTVAVTTAQAQEPDQIILGGSTHKYVVDSTDNGTSLEWSVSDGTESLTQSTTGGSAVIVWGNTSGLYTITLTETNTFNDAACATPNEFIVQVVAGGALTFAESTSEGCADGQDVKLSLLYNGTINASTPITITYKINADGEEQSLTIDEESDLTDAITIDGSTYRADEDKRPVENREVQVIITGAPEGVNISSGNTHTHTVIDIPESNDIIAL